ncbi:unnamed protein product [Ceutorhynchus assimilis]|uniref:PDZ domain-containing protein n=1 Tax=Ceutorhynchus assimilis TaxID=467358 RepID=A0A9N9MXH5_9CUCU|nr:unnamed protein product [Ceutorhynchus assimilis]
MAATVKFHLFLVTVILLIAVGHGQETVDSAGTCYGAGSIVGAVLGTFLGTLLLLGALLFLYKKRMNAKKDNHLILETDPERGPKAEYAFDNPGFKDTSIIVATSEKKPDNKTNKWTHWSPLTALNLKPEKKRALDDSALQNHEVKVVALKSQDFTGLGFNICGNMKEGIFIKDILHRGPAFESGKLNPGDRINSLTISFEHMVYEDAMNILSYASPYEVILEAKSGRTISFQQGQGQTPIHPIYRTCSAIDLSLIPEKSSKKKLFGDDYSSSSNYSSLQKSRSNVTTLERKESKSPRPPMKPKSKSPQKLTPEETQNYQKFGVRVLPLEHHQKSPKIVEQNQNNSNIERHYNMEEVPIRGIDEVDLKPPQARKREKKSPEPAFERNNSGIKRDSNGIPLEIPNHMQDAALAARRNRKSSIENGLGEDSNKKHKPKAPSPPPINFSLGGSKIRAFEDLSALGTDSEDDTNNMSSVNTIELNSSDITIHQIQEEERKSRKTASTGDLTKMKKQPRSNNGTLERAQSLDITDTTGHGLTKKSTYDATENLLIDKEPRLSLILDGLTTFQRTRLKTSTEWGNLEDAILNLNDERKSDPQLTAVMDRALKIKREEIIPDEIVKSYQATNGPKVYNKLWPDESELNSANKTSLEIDTEPIRRQPVVPERLKPQPTERVSKNNNEVAKPVPPKRELPADRCSTEINLNHTLCKVSLVTAFEKNNITELCSQLAKGKNSEMIKDEWEVDTLTNTSPPQSMTLVDEVMDSYNRNFGADDESKNMKNVIDDFIFNERSAHQSETNIPDDVKVSRNSSESFEAKKFDDDVKVAKSSFGAVDPKKVDSVDDVKVTSQSNDKNMFEKVEVASKPNDDVQAYSLSKFELASTSEDDVKVSTSSIIEKVNLHQIPKSEDVIEVKHTSKNDLFDETNPSQKSDIQISTLNSIIALESDNQLKFEKVKLKPKSQELEIVEPKRHIPNFNQEVTVSTSDDSKSDDSLISHVTVTENGASNLHSLELSINSEPNELYKTVVDNEVTLIMSQPNIITAKEPLVEITESCFSKVTKTPEANEVEITTVEVDDEIFKSIDDESPAISLITAEEISDDKKTYVTEIQVLPSPTTTTNVSEIEIKSEDHLEDAFENYVKNFEKKLETFESNMQNFENNLEEFIVIREEPQAGAVSNEKIDIEKQVSKIQEIAEEQLKTLPEMKFSTSSYESSNAGRKTPEKRHSFELLRSNFEKSDKSPPRRESTGSTPPKSRIPISTTMKTPPMSPERRDSRNLDNENDKAILELMSSPPSKIKPPSTITSTKNVSVTSIRQNSKIPSGLPTLSSRPPIPPRKTDETSNGGVESSFKQWVFNPNSNVTNVAVGKEK